MELREQPGKIIVFSVENSKQNRIGEPNPVWPTRQPSGQERVLNLD